MSTTFPLSSKSLSDILGEISALVEASCDLCWAAALSLVKFMPPVNWTAKSKGDLPGRAFSGAIG